MDTKTVSITDVLSPIFASLERDYEKVEHPPVFTIDDAIALVPPIDGAKTKNVFLRDAKGTRHFLVVVPHDRRVDLTALSNRLPSTKLSMGSPERLQKHLGVTPGAVSLFALVNDTSAAVELIIDETIWKARRVQGHPLRNTATVSVSHAALEAFLAHVGHHPKVMQVP
jgi:Ala-tRNA(Pro) deacylase